MFTGTTERIDEVSLSSQWNAERMAVVSKLPQMYSINLHVKVGTTTWLLGSIALINLVVINIVARVHTCTKSHADACVSSSI